MQYRNIAVTVVVIQLPCTYRLTTRCQQCFGKIPNCYVPVCATKQRSLHRAAKNDELRVQCAVRAEPANVTFQWSLNASSGARRELAWASASGSDGFASSLLLYTPENESDYGLLSCWARNAVGLASEPCLAEILPLGPPRAPRNCSVARQVAGSLRVECEPGRPGVAFQLEVRQRRRLLANLSSASPSFWLNALPAAGHCTLLVYAVEGGERSAPLRLSATVLAAQGYSERGMPPLICIRSREQAGRAPRLLDVRTLWKALACLEAAIGR
ncbi:hypothetical protein HPB48_014958 [Haemaphysalis longicornis]|uniref:Ig-like domain-containing protein n=1 Tax=Haemaphysalis longicornis TaxID=44386 RepID=A0A9J6FGC7_HAELO|nr:hypothetical protein HPB48_014958 [Haemaphysalis longicornis]